MPNLDSELATSSLVLTADPGFEQMAMAEAREAAPDLFVQTKLQPGIWLIGLDKPFGIVASQWRIKPPIFVRHICPVHVSARVNIGPSLLEEAQLLFLSELSAFVPTDLAFSIQTRVLHGLGVKPFELNTALAKLVQEEIGAPLNVPDPQQVISVIVAKPLESESTAVSAGATEDAAILMGLSNVEDNLSDWAGGMHRFARDSAQISRSEFKLLEALAHFNIELAPRGVALDLGAAPGGWTRILRLHEQYVTAVDPSELDVSVARDPRVRHKRMSAQQYLRDGPDMFDLIVNDMRMDARDSSRMIGAFAPFLYDHGMVIMTLKLPETNRWRVLNHAMQLLQESYIVEGARQLFHNRSEITVVFRRKGQHMQRNVG